MKSYMEHKLNISTGLSRFERRWKAETLTWGELRQRLSTPAVTAETAAEYRRMPPQRQTDVKDVGGFVGGTLREGLRKAGHVYSRSVVTLDYDEFGEPRLEELRAAVTRLGNPFWLLHSTHKHTARQWRVRVVMPLAREVGADEYVAIARRVASEIGFDGIDRSTFEPSRLMFWPSRSKDGDWLLEEGGDTMLDPAAVLATYRDWRDMGEWPLLPEEDLGGLFGDRQGEAQGIRQRGGQAAGKQEDPRVKPGLVGAFCRAYTVGEAIEAFLPGVYTRSGASRWTHSGSTTTGGAWELEGGRFLYSFHATDPLMGRLLNSWDLVRLARFGDLDGESAGGRKPSEKRMEELAIADAKVKVLLMEERKAQAMADFPDSPSPALPSGEGDAQTDAQTGDPYEEWDRIRGAAFRVKKDGTTVTDANSLALVFTKHPDIAGTFRYDDFSGNVEVIGKLPWRHVGRWWNNIDDACLRNWLDRELGMTGKEKIADAFDNYANAHGHHPVREYLAGLIWDGVERCATVLTHVLGAEDTRLNRALTELFFTAAVRRVKEPGVKYDTVLTLQGEEGTGKSSFFSILGGEWFSDSPLDIGNKDGMASLQGKWIYELSELTGVKKKDVEAVKQFFSSQFDRFRPAFCRRDEIRPRQCVFGATTNEDYFLRGINNDTRRQPVIKIEPGLRRVAEPVREWLEKWRDQLWAEAVVIEARGKPLVLPEDLREEAKEVRKEYNLDLNNPLFPEVERFLDLALPMDWEQLSTEQRVEWLRRNNGEDEGMVEDFDYYRRDRVTVPEILQELFGMRKTDRDYASRGREVGRFLKTLEGWKQVGNKRDKLYGVQKSWIRTEANVINRDPFADL